MTAKEKPPVGLRPRLTADLERVSEIAEAIQRYADHGEPIPMEWVQELTELVSRHSANVAELDSRTSLNELAEKLREGNHGPVAVYPSNTSDDDSAFVPTSVRYHMRPVYLKGATPDDVAQFTAFLDYVASKPGETHAIDEAIRLRNALKKCVDAMDYSITGFYADGAKITLNEAIREGRKAIGESQ